MASSQESAEERATALLATLSSADEPTSARASAAVKLRALVASPDAADYVLRSYTELFGSIEVLLDDRSGVVRAQAAASLGILGACLKPELHAFAGWLLHAAHTRSGRPERLPSGQLLPSPWSLLLSALHECVQQLHRERAAAAVLPFLPELLGCVQSMLRELHEPSLLAALLPLLATLARPETAAAVRPHFAELVDLLLGWALDPRSASGANERICEALGGQLGPLWAASAPFAVGLMHKLVDDVERLHLPDGAHASDGAATAQWAAQLGRFVRVFCAAASGLGPRYAQLAEQPALTARLLACLNAAVREPKADGDGGDEDEEDGRLRPPLLSAAGRTFAAVATDCVATLSRLLRGGFAPHHAAAVRLIHVQLADGASSSAVLRALSLHLAVLRAQQGALPPTAAHDLTRADSPLLRLRRKRYRCRTSP